VLVTYYLFAGQVFYPTSVPGDFVLRGTEAECRAALASMGEYVVRRYDDGRIVLGLTPGYLGEMPDDDTEHYATPLQWWVIVDEDMRVVERAG
jgi:hypothetical protein